MADAPISDWMVIERDRSKLGGNKNIDEKVFGIHIESRLLAKRVFIYQRKAGASPLLYGPEVQPS